MTEAEQQALKDQTVIPLIIENGKIITLINPNQGAFDPDTGFVGGVPIDDTGYGLELQSNIETVPASLADKWKKTMMCVEIAKPVPEEDKLLVGTVTYKILGIDEVKPGNVSFFYTLYLGS